MFSDTFPSLCFQLEALLSVIFYLFIFFVQATSALAGLLEEDSIATDESKLIDNAWRGAEVFFPLTTLFRPWVITSATTMNASL